MHKHPQAFGVTISDRTISVHGDVDLAVVDQLVAAITCVANDQGDRAVALDLAQLTFLDSSGIHGLLTAHQSLAAAGKELVIQNIPERARHTLTVAGAMEHLNVRSVV